MKAFLILLLLPLFTKAQRKHDTIPMIMLACDTTVKTTNLVNTLGLVYWCKGYSVREKHNTFELAKDEGYIAEANARNYPFEDYYIHLQYLDENYKRLGTGVVVWMASPTIEIKSFFTKTKP
jgi:hypothetical protein